MRRASMIIALALSVLVSCTERMICPAYQSAYIYDKDELRKKFSYFANDTTPKVYSASKTRYLVAEPMSYQKRIRNLQTVAMKAVPVVVPDSISGEKSDSVSMADLDRAARSVIDSTFIVDTPQQDSVAQPLEDSVYVITKDREVRLLKYNGPDSLVYDEEQQKYVRQKPQYYVSNVRYNLEQDHYMWYLRDVLILPDVRLARMRQSGEGAAAGQKEKQGLRGFFRNLFKKKKEAGVDSTQLTPPPAEEFDYVDIDTTMQAEIPQPGQEDKKEKKGLFGRKKKKVKPAPKKNETEEQDPAQKKEDEDDGF